MTDLSSYTPRETPGHVILNGRYVRVEPLDWERHGLDLYAAVSGAGHEALWDYITFGPFEDFAAFKAAMQAKAKNGPWQTMVICDPHSGRVTGCASYMRIRENFGSVEVGCVIFGPALQQSRAATEAMYLMAQHAFDDLGYRRYEWKCDNANAPSKRAALRFCFEYEGVFRNDLIIKGKNRDTAWFAMTDADWPKVKSAFHAWLDPYNFDSSGRQKKSLADIRN